MRYTVHCFAVLATLALPVAGEAYLDALDLGNGTLDHAGDFMTYCSDGAHAPACAGRVQEQDRYNIASLSDKCASTLPDTDNSGTHRTNAKLVVDWIASHREFAPDSTDNAIKRAELTLWPCRQQKL
ncbi:MAG: hypothetical protein ACLQUZ_07615 [Rhizomicrobium sp.]